MLIDFVWIESLFVFAPKVGSRCFPSWKKAFYLNYNTRKPGKMDGLKLRMIAFIAVSSVMSVALQLPLPPGYTCEQDVYAINNLHAALGYPLLPGWVPLGGDPCLQEWQGIQCVGPNITAIVLNGANLGGELGVYLGNFTSLITIDLSNNHIGGSIPESLPLTLRQFFLSSNRLMGRIPSSLADLTLLSDMSLNENFLSGELPDSFQSLAGLVNLDVSSNNLSGLLPPSMASLTSLITLHIQNNHLSGFLDVLQDLPLMDLNIENNLFSGPIPERLSNIPNFKSTGNPFNTTIAPSSPPPQVLPFLVAPVPSPGSDAVSPYSDFPPTPHGGKTSKSVIVYVALAAILVIVALLVLCCASKLRERLLNHVYKLQNQKKMMPEMSQMTKEQLSSTNLIGPIHYKEKFSRYSLGKQKEREVHIVEAPDEKVTVEPIASLKKEKDLSFGKVRPPIKESTPPASVAFFSVASLQQYTNYFGEEHLIRSTCLGNVYKADLSDGRLLTVMKLSKLTSKINVDDFDDLVFRVSELRHPNIVELVGYCSEFGQRLFIFKYFSRWTLYDSLHSHDLLEKRLSWNARIQIALATARAIEYLHESCKPPIILRNLEPTSILLDDDLSLCISECGLASFILSNSLSQFTGDSRLPSAYDAPEISDSESYTDRSDVYSFGVVMLELLTGRKPFDSSRRWEEQHLIRWVSPQLYDINALSRIVDPCIDGVVSLKSLSRFADIISLCIEQSPEFRPMMSQVVQDLILLAKDARIL